MRAQREAEEEREAKKESTLQVRFSRFHQHIRNERARIPWIEKNVDRDSLGREKERSESLRRLSLKAAAATLPHAGPKLPRGTERCPPGSSRDE